jgi:hypothetical protein
MKISNEALTILKGELPRGSVPKIRLRLQKKNTAYSQQYIYRCLDPKQTDYNLIIITEAVALCEELAKGTEALEERVLQLRKALQ